MLHRIDFAPNIIGARNAALLPPRTAHVICARSLAGESHVTIFREYPPERCSPVPDCFAPDLFHPLFPSLVHQNDHWLNEQTVYSSGRRSVAQRSVFPGAGLEETKAKLRRGNVCCGQNCGLKLSAGRLESDGVLLRSAVDVPVAK